jgi:hypothetical protein
MMCWFGVLRHLNDRRGVNFIILTEQGYYRIYVCHLVIGLNVCAETGADSTASGLMINGVSALPDGAAKSPPHGVTAVFQDLDIQHVCLHP